MGLGGVGYNRKNLNLLSLQISPDSGLIWYQLEHILKRNTSTKWSLEDRRMGDKWGRWYRKHTGQTQSDFWFPTLWSIHVASGFVYDCLHSWESLGLFDCFFFQNPTQQDTSFLLLLPFYQERTEWKLFNLPPPTPPDSQHYWHDLMPHNRSNFVIMTQRQQLKSIAYFRAYKLTVGNWQQNVFSNPLKWYPIASWHGNYCICTVPEEFQPEFDRELIKSPRCNWRFWLHCLLADQH